MIVTSPCMSGYRELEEYSESREGSLGFEASIFLTIQALTHPADVSQLRNHFSSALELNQHTKQSWDTLTRYLTRVHVSDTRKLDAVTLPSKLFGRKLNAGTLSVRLYPLEAASV